MAKKRTRLTEPRRGLERKWSTRWRNFLKSGALGSIILLILFSIALGFILSAGGQSDGGRWVRPEFRIFVITTSVMLLLNVAFGLYVVTNEPKIVKNHLRGAQLLFLLLVLFALIRFGILQGWSMYLVVVPVMIVGITMTIAYNQRFALGISSFLVLLSVLAMADQDVSLKDGLGVLLAAGGGTGIAVLLLKKILSFTRLLEVCVFAGIVVGGLTLVFGLWQGYGKGVVLTNSLYGVIGAISVGFLMQGLLPMIEKVFYTATDMTLLHYGEQTHPLLRRLAVEAPGTFNHSWQIGMLAEAAAEAIGANGLLCRVGSYYHDVGKLNKPRYFVENQEENFNQHKELAPTMSRMIIVGHVKDGVELLSEYRIPQILHQFTETHHGTTLVEFFYHEAAKRREKTGEKIEEVEFRYPGPKPHTRESAIVMLADVVEGATRAMKEPTPSRIEQLVHKMAMKRLQDGQLNECDLTMRDLNMIEKSLVKSLCAMYHGRISYPKPIKATGRA